MHIHSFVRVRPSRPSSFSVVVPLVSYFVLVAFVLSSALLPSRLGFDRPWGSTRHSFNSSLCAAFPKVTRMQRGGDRQRECIVFYCSCTCILIPCPSSLISRSTRRCVLRSPSATPLVAAYSRTDFFDRSESSHSRALLHNSYSDAPAVC